MLMAQVTDIHLGFDPDNPAEFNRKRLDQALKALREMTPQPDMLLATGDLVDRGDQESYQRLEDAFSDLPFPVHMCLGNHDLREPFLKQFPDAPTADGFVQYEVSAYAQAGKQAIHNLNYWQFGDYLGIGAGAHGKVTDLVNAPESLTASRVFRTWKTRAPKDFLNAGKGDAKHNSKGFLAGKESIQNEDLGLEFLMNALRLQDGFDLNLFEQRTGFPLDTIADGINAAIEKGLLIKQGSQIKTTPQGSLFLNEILAFFM